MAAITVAVAYGVALSLSRSLQALTLAALALFIGVFVGVVVMPIFVTNPVGWGEGVGAFQSTVQRGVCLSN